MGLHERPAGREMQPSARGRLRAAAASLKPQIHNSKFRITKSGSNLRRAVRSGPAGREGGPPPPQAAARSAFSRPKFMIQNSRFKISCGTNPRGMPAAERMGLRRGGAALRLRAAAGCQSLRD